MVSGQAPMLTLGSPGGAFGQSSPSTTGLVTPISCRNAKPEACTSDASCALNPKCPTRIVPFQSATILGEPLMPMPLSPANAWIVMSSIESTSPSPYSSIGTRWEVSVASEGRCSPFTGQPGINIDAVSGCRINPPSLVRGLKLPSLLVVPKYWVRFVGLVPPFTWHNPQSWFV